MELRPKDTDVEEAVRRIALINAVSFEGKAREDSVLGRLLAEKPNLKARVREILPLISRVVREVNRLSLNEQRSIVQQRWPEALRKEKREEKRALPPLPNVEKYRQVVTRFAPNPDCVLHLGSARAIILSHEYAQIYGGHFILRFEDTDPRLKRSALQFIDSIREDLLWLGCKWDAEYIQSDRLPIYYDYAERLIRDGHAYVCTCPSKKFRELVFEKKPCPCRDLTPNENMRRWNCMLNGTYGRGEAVLRIKTDLDHPNPAVRDWPALRIIDPKRYPHPRVGDKYRVWPLYNFASGVDDHLMGVTHIIRGKEHLTNQERQKYLYRYLGWEYPEAIHYGRLKIVGASLSKSEILRGVKSGLYKSWDDPRLATFAALRRRGITPEAIRLMMIDIGPRPADIVLSWDNLYAYNRKLVDPIANRFFFVQNPLKLIVKRVPSEFTADIPLHPDRPQRGFRRLKVNLKNNEAWLLISKNDLPLMKEGAVLRLMELFNFKAEIIEKDAVLATFHSQSYEEARKLNAPLIHWIPYGTGLPCSVVMPDGSTLTGFVEDDFTRVRQGEVVQFERFGFVRVDEVNGRTVVYYAHR
ncbi:MAG: glutamate--tRNA ligase [Candidatus Bathyarchaeia archaeon]